MMKKNTISISNNNLLPAKLNINSLQNFMKMSYIGTYSFIKYA